jgi:hypothetical protein
MSNIMSSFRRQNASNRAVSRRDFNRLAGLAVGGLVLGSTVTARAAENNAANILTDPHICRGLNQCKGKGKGGDNACAGEGGCATTGAHSCSGSNACKGQGGCGEHPGENSCKGQGDCGTPLKPATWKKARKTFEAQMTKKGKKFGAAPKAKA